MYILTTMQWDLSDIDEVPINNPLLFSSKHEASVYACYLIQDFIDTEWDLDDSKVAIDAKKIQDLIVTGNTNNDYLQYMSAIDLFHCSQHFSNNANDFRRQFTFSHRVLQIAVAVPKILPLHRFTGLPTTSLPLHSSLGSSVSVCAPKVKAFVAQKAGAKCRLQCGQEYEYAYADQADGTFECRGCKMMHQVFST